MNSSDQRTNNINAAVPGEELSRERALMRETVNVLSRSAGEPLDEYLHNINSYLNGLNERLGIRTRPEEPAAPAAPETAGPVLFGEPVGFAPVGAAPAEENEERKNAIADNIRDSFYTESVTPDGRPKSHWQAAVPNPELYPDLDDPALRKKRGRRREKKDLFTKPARHTKDRAAVRQPGEKSRFSFVTTLINLGVYGFWIIAYFICDISRSLMFSGAQSEMAAQGVTNYTIVVSSPMFTVLKILLYLMPVILVLWMAGVLKADKEQRPQIDKRLLIAACAADLFTGILAIADVLAVRLILG